MRLRSTARATPTVTVVAALALAAAVTAISVKPWNGHPLGLHAMRVMLVIVAIGVGFAFDDPAASTTAASPTPLPVRRAMRLTLAGGMAVTGVALVIAVMSLVSGRGPSVPWSVFVVEGAAVVSLALAASVMSMRRSGSSTSGGPAAVSTVAGFVLMALLVGRRFPNWALLATPYDQAWTSSRWAWAAIGVVSMAIVAWHSRDPAAPPLART